MTYHAGNGRNGKHYWLTPPEVLSELDREFHFDFDPCPNPRPDGFDGLVIPWGASNYVNPPFGGFNTDGRKVPGVTAWARKAIAEAKEGRTVCFVYPLDKWIHEMLSAGASIRNLGDVRWLATEDRSPGPGIGRHIGAFILKGQK